jgi:hypothetical protein
MNISRTLVIGFIALQLLFGAVGAETSSYSTVLAARAFAIGGVGYAGVTTREEIAMRAIRESKGAHEQLRKLLRDATPAGQMYALFALRQLDAPDYSSLAEPFRHRSTPVLTISGCIVHTDSMSETVRWIDQWAKKIRT